MGAGYDARVMRLVLRINLVLGCVVAIYWLLSWSELGGFFVSLFCCLLLIAVLEIVEDSR